MGAGLGVMSEVEHVGVKWGEVGDFRSVVGQRGRYMCVVGE